MHTVYNTTIEELLRRRGYLRSLSYKDSAITAELEAIFRKLEELKF
jgi:hypothetical protein